MAKTEIPFAVKNHGPQAVAIYRKAIRNGESAGLAEMLALRSPPGGQTDSTFFAGLTLEKQFKGDEKMLKTLTERAMARGFKPNPESIYVDTLADDIGDPKAFVTMSDGRSHIKKIAEEKGVDAYEKDGTCIAKGYSKPARDPMEVNPTVEANKKRRSKKK